MGFPAIPGWDGIHPAMVQFAIVLLFVSPLLLIVSLFMRQSWRAWSGAFLLMMGLGAFATWLAVASGHAGGQLVDKTPALEHAIAAHEALGILTRNLFSALALVFAVLLIAEVRLRDRVPAALRITINVVFLIAYLGCTTFLANTASRGGQLVHDAGIRAMVDKPIAAVTATPEATAPSPSTAPHAPTPQK
jgi:uncharacterized membrane protein